MTKAIHAQKLQRGSGILLHISSLPSQYGSGDFGPAAYRFADFLEAAGQTYWQILPLNPTDGIYGNSPYSSNSAFAINPVFVSPEFLAKDGWLPEAEIRPVPNFPGERVDYAAAGEYKQILLGKAFDRAKAKLAGRKDFQAFCRQESAWLDDYALFMALKKKFSGASWTQWPVDIRQRDENTLADFAAGHQEDIDRIKFFQFILFSQWAKLRNYCQGKKVRIIGDIPIYVNDDSVDVWANPTIFKLDEQLNPKFVAGVPPDYFSATGQRWGNPIYDWDVLKSMDYEWWLARLRRNFELYDVVRIDHFRGLVDYWQIPAHESTAVVGEWQTGPGDDFLRTLLKNFSHLPLIAEDLGILSPQVPETMERFRFPGMKILVFAFGGDMSGNPYLPDKYTANCVAYTGTHDNNTVCGWWQNEVSFHEKKNLAKYLKKHRIRRKKELNWLFIELLADSKAEVVIFPLPDVLGLGAEARMNTPGVAHGNWEWRLAVKNIDAAVIKKLREVTHAAKRE